jgi:hypothetical protein
MYRTLVVLVLFLALSGCASKAKREAEAQRDLDLIAAACSAPRNYKEVGVTTEQRACMAKEVLKMRAAIESRPDTSVIVVPSQPASPTCLVIRNGVCTQWR